VPGSPNSRSTLGIRNPDGYLKIEGRQIAWAAYPPERASNLQPVICLHDAGSGSREFQPLLKSQPLGSRIILIDWPGHGSSASPSTSEGMADVIADGRMDRCVGLLRSALEQLAVHRPILLGSGFGAAVALQYASQNAGSILGLILCQPAGLIPSKAAGSKPLSTCFPKLTQSASRPAPAARRQALRLEALKPEMQPYTDAARAELQRSQPSLQAALAGLKTPVLFTLSRDSRQFPLQSYLNLLDPLLAQSPQHRITVFTGSFHPAWDEPHRFAQAINGFMQSQLPFAVHHHAWLLAAADYPATNMNLWKCVHPECSAEQALPAQANPNAA
jgi:pimeloyl-ACP methyl ester carboxylesterase